VSQTVSLILQGIYINI